MEGSVISSTTKIAAPARRRQVTNKSEDVNVPIGYKRCSHCGKILPVSEFYKNKATKDGYNAWCRVCHNDAQKNYAQNRRKSKKGKVEISDGHKRCSCCGEIKPLSEFSFNKANKDGYESRCRVCRNAKRRIADKARREKDKAQQQEQQPVATQPKLPFDYERRIKRAHALSFAPDTKECKQCHQVKPMTEFQTCSKNVDHIADTCKQCMSDNRKKKNIIKKQQEEEAMKKQAIQQQNQAAHKNNVQTFEFLPVGTMLYYIKNEKIWATPVKGVIIDVSQNGTLISYKIEDEPSAKPSAVYMMEIGRTVFCNEIDLMNHIVKKAGIKMDGEVANKLAFKVTAETIGHYQ